MEVPLMTASRRWDGKPETDTDRRFFDLRESGYTGWIDQDGYAVSDGEIDRQIAAVNGTARTEYVEALVATLKAAGADGEEIAAARREAFAEVGMDPGPCTACKGTGIVASSAGPTGSQYRKCRACG
jgi:hypothetical protein